MGVVNSLKAAGLYDGIQFGTPSASPGGSVDYLQWFDLLPPSTFLHR